MDINTLRDKTRVPLIDVIGGSILLYIPMFYGFLGKTFQKEPFKYSILLCLPVGYLFHVLFGVQTPLRQQLGI